MQLCYDCASNARTVKKAIVWLQVSNGMLHTLDLSLQVFANWTILCVICKQTIYGHHMRFQIFLYHFKRFTCSDNS